MSPDKMTQKEKKNHATRSDDASREMIARRAYELWEASGRPMGRDLEHWLQAEQAIHPAKLLTRPLLKEELSGAKARV